MNKVFSITPVNEDPFMITWDLGRRCNYDCSYCPSHRHDNFSPHASLDELKNTTEFLFDYAETIAKHRINKDFHVSFTGGEPTVNPNFIEFAEYVRTKKDQYKDKFNLHLSLTTNGAMGEKLCNAVIKNFDYVTVSYHCEAPDRLKAQALSRISQIHTSGKSLKVNVMFHADYFQECKDVCESLKVQGIKFIPRVIGDDPDSASSQAHLYTEEQKTWFKNFWNIELTPTTRPCCGGRTFGTCSSQGTAETNVIVDRAFKGWHCSVNWYFLHIEQQTGLVYHHQTCQATLDNTRGSIGSLTDTNLILRVLQDHLDNNTMPLIVCPNKLCGCGLCTPKSVDRSDLLTSMSRVVNNVGIFTNV